MCANTLHRCHHDDNTRIIVMGYGVIGSTTAIVAVSGGSTPPTPPKKI